MGEMQGGVLSGPSIGARPSSRLHHDRIDLIPLSQRMEASTGLAELRLLREVQEEHIRLTKVSLACACCCFDMF
jgi:hypothetical protein